MNPAQILALTQDVLGLAKRYAEAQAKSERAMDARRNLPLGSSRARRTTANARWARAAEERDRVHDNLRTAILTLAVAAGFREIEEAP